MEEGLQVWRVAANVVNKQSRTADKGWYSILGVERGANIVKNESCYEISQGKGTAAIKTINVTGCVAAGVYAFCLLCGKALP